MSGSFYVMKNTVSPFYFLNGAIFIIDGDVAAY